MSSFSLSSQSICLISVCFNIFFLVSSIFQYLMSSCKNLQVLLRWENNLSITENLICLHHTLPILEMRYWSQWMLGNLAGITALQLNPCLQYKDFWLLYSWRLPIGSFRTFEHFSSYALFIAWMSVTQQWWSMYLGALMRKYFSDLSDSSSPTMVNV